MINNLAITKRLINEFDIRLDLLKSKLISFPDSNEIKLGIASIQSQLDSLNLEVLEYERLKSGSINFYILDSLLDIDKILICARIAKGWTQAKLGNKLNLNEQQIQRYESDNYSSASLKRIQEVIIALEIDKNPIRVKLNEKTQIISSPTMLTKINDAYSKLSERRSLINI
ncbi:MAG: helix-turn-helix transcriptional regulator [Saprospiraceae bacterium]|nr:helix-turn-helix transcriptional regulator [Candidatus Opimibacter skivensis]